MHYAGLLGWRVWRGIAGSLLHYSGELFFLARGEAVRCEAGQQ